MKGFVYILRCNDGTYYTGSTDNIEECLNQHSAGLGASHTKKRLPVDLVFLEEFQLIDEASFRAKQIQAWNRDKKETLINKCYDKLPALAQCGNVSHYHNAKGKLSSVPVKDKSSSQSVKESHTLNGVEAKGQIATGLEMLGIKAANDKLQKLDSFVDLLQKWNQAYNLTALKSKQEIEILHILDSACVLSFIRGTETLDVGTGAGLPGVVLAILNKKLKVTLLDGNNKKIRFLRQCKLELVLDNVNPVHSRIEDFKPEQKFTSIVSRAFSSFDEFADKCLGLGTTEAILIAMKGKWEETSKYDVKVNKVKVPYLNAKRHIISYQA